MYQASQFGIIRENMVQQLSNSSILDPASFTEMPKVPKHLILTLLVLFVLSYFCIPRRLVDKSGFGIPKGPRGLPIVGSFPFLSHFPERTLDYWARKYGDLYSLWLGNQLFMIVSDPTIAKDLIVSNGLVFSGRKEMFIKSQTIFAGRGITATPYNDRWRKHRRIAYSWLCDKAIDGYVQVLDRESIVMVNSMLEESGSGTRHINPQADEPVPECLAKTMLLNRDEEGLDRLDMIILASAFMIGGVETTASVMQWFIGIIAKRPDIQAKAHEELDRVVGRDRLPTAQDEQHLPYVRAIIKEVERFRNPFWLGTPHTATEDFNYQGHFIPKDTVIVLNTYTMHHDETRYPEPQIFSPDRYVSDTLSSTESSKLNDANQRDHWMFGAGRRICPGMHVAEREIFYAISRILWCFDLTEVPEDPIDLTEYDGLSGRSPMPFRVQLELRHEKAFEIMTRADTGGLR